MHRNWWILGALLSRELIQNLASFLSTLTLRVVLLNVIGLSVAVSVKYKYDPFYLDAIRLLSEYFAIHDVTQLTCIIQIFQC